MILEALVLGGIAFGGAATTQQAVRLSTPTFSRVVAAAAPCVVSITAVRRGWSATPAHAPSPDEPLKRFLEEDVEPQQLIPPGPSLGSGVIVSSDGYIVTNNHVIDGAQDIKVALAGGAEHGAKVVGRDAKTDIAVLKIEAAGLSPAVFGDSSKTAIGDVVLALGNPFGIGQTVTMGIISATGRGNVGFEGYEDFIQTDAAINPGNSGGALVDSQGQVIGINTAILTRTGANHGIGFAVPSNLARYVIGGLIKDGRVVRGQLGLSAQDLTPELALRFSPQLSQGALVNHVVKDSAAQAAGIKPGDVIVSFNGQGIPDSRALRLQTGQQRPGSAARLTVIRGKKRLSLRTTLKDAHEQPGPAEAPAASTLRIIAGAILDDLTPQSRSHLQIPADVQGALIVGVERGSPSYDAGLRPGAVILEVDRRTVDSARQAWSAIRRSPIPEVLLRVWEGSANRYMLVRFRAAPG